MRRGKRVATEMRSEHVTVVWVQITHTLFLVFWNRGTLVRVIPPRVLQDETGEIDDICEERKANEANADGIAGVETTG